MVPSASRNYKLVFMTEEVWKDIPGFEDDKYINCRAPWLYRPESSRKSAEHRKSKIHGVGVNDINLRLKGVKLYVVWKSMFTRCYNPKFHENNPRYKECTVDSRWHKLSAFKEWFDENYKDGYALDKDILIKDNKIYGPDTCCFVPDYINRVFKTNTHSGRKMMGVRHQCNKFLAHIRCGGKEICKSFNSYEEAREYYVNQRVLYLTEVAKEYFDKGLITQPVYNGLIRIANDNY